MAYNERNLVFSAYTFHDATYDEQRCGALATAIESQVRPGDFVVTTGFGTGAIAATLAAKAGAARVINYEIHEETAINASHFLEDNDVSDRVEIVHADPRTVEPPQQVDGLIVDMGRVGLTDTPQLEVVRHFRQFMAAESYTIPGKSVHGMRLLHVPRELYGLEFLAEARTASLPGDRIVSTRSNYLTVNYGSGDLPTDIDSTVTVRGLTRLGSPATANAVQLTLRQHFAVGTVVDRPTKSLWPLTLLLPEEISVRSGHEYELSIAYSAGAMPNAINVSARPK